MKCGETCSNPGEFSVNRFIRMSTTENSINIYIRQAHQNNSVGINKYFSVEDSQSVDISFLYNHPTGINIGLFNYR